MQGPEVLMPAIIITGVAELQVQMMRQPVVTRELIQGLIRMWPPPGPEAPVIQDTQDPRSQAIAPGMLEIQTAIQQVQGVDLLAAEHTGHLVDPDQQAQPTDQVPATEVPVAQELEVILQVLAQEAQDPL